MSKKLTGILTAILLHACLETKAQSNIRDSSIAMHIVSIGYTIQLPAGDLADRFGFSSMVGGSYAYKLKNNWILSLNGGFIFGDQLKEDSILNNIANEDGLILGNDGNFASINLYERGIHFSLTAGKLFPFKKPNPNSGIIIQAGPSFLQHKIRIETSEGVPQLNNEYKKGYDRLTNGIGLNESVTYVYFGNKYLVNFYFGLDLIQSFTKNRRDFNFDTMSKDDSSRIDLLFGFKAGWMLPLYRKAPQKFYYY